MNNYSIISAIKGCVINRQLLIDLILREIQARYRGTVLGFTWLVIYPVLMISVYSFVFGSVFKSRWSNQGSMGDFVIMLFCGLTVFTIFSDVANRASSTITGTPNYVKKVVFPLELLPLVQVGVSLFNAVISFLILCALILALNHSIPWTALFVPFVLLPLLFLTAGVSWGLAALGVFFRDLGQIVGIVTSLMLFLSPVFFSVSSAPEAAHFFLNINPLTYPIEEMRNVLIIGEMPNWLGYSLHLLVAIAVLSVGLWFFQRTRSAFSDVL